VHVAVAANFTAAAKDIASKFEAATGDTAILAPSLIAERAHIDEIVDKLRTTLMDL